MRCIKFILVSMLLALGLTASTYSAFDTVGISATGAAHSFVSAGDVGQDKPDPAKDFSSREQLARGLNRRAGSQAGPERLLLPVTGPVFGLVQLQQPRIVSRGTERSFELARCWQFHWRTACEPRAPSTVS